MSKDMLMKGLFNITCGMVTPYQALMTELDNRRSRFSPEEKFIINRAGGVAEALRQNILERTVDVFLLPWPSPAAVDDYEFTACAQRIKYLYPYCLSINHSGHDAIRVAVVRYEIREAAVRAC